MIHFACGCGAQLEVEEIFLGGHVMCQACGTSVQVPADLISEDEKFRFNCPHCRVRVTARKLSAGKKSQCPSCGLNYIVPEPPEEPPSLSPKKGKRIEIDEDVDVLPSLSISHWKRDKNQPAPPQPRFLHSFAEIQAAQDVAEMPAIEIEPAPTQDPAPVLEPKAEDTPDVGANIVEPDEIADDAFPATARDLPTPFAESAPPLRDRNLPTADAIPQMGFERQIASVGELRVIRRGRQEQAIRMDFARLLVGYEADCDLRPSGSLISRHHCVFKRDEYAVRVRDLGSTMGTFVNGRRISSEVILNPGDEVMVADIRLFVILPESPHVVYSTVESDPSISDFVIL
jgi:hypothetical protein